MSSTPTKHEKPIHENKKHDIEVTSKRFRVGKVTYSINQINSVERYDNQVKGTTGFRLLRFPLALALIIATYFITYTASDNPSNLSLNGQERWIIFGVSVVIGLILLWSSRPRPSHGFRFIRFLFAIALVVATYFATSTAHNNPEDFQITDQTRWIIFGISIVLALILLWVLRPRESRLYGVTISLSSGQITPEFKSTNKHEADAIVRALIQAISD